jgi:hypothetical protein
VIIIIHNDKLYQDLKLITVGNRFNAVSANTDNSTHFAFSLIINYIFVSVSIGVFFSKYVM